MKTQTALKPARIAALLAAMTAASLTPGFAANLYWDAAATSPWLTATNWSTDLAGENQAAAAPTISDDVIFNSTPFNGAANSAAVGGNIAARSLTFSSGAGMTLSHGNNTWSLALGAGGITVGEGSSGTIGTSSGSLFTEATVSQTWANNSSGALTVRRLRASNSATGVTTVTLSANSTGNISFNNSISDSADGTKQLGIVIDSAGTGTVTLLGAGTSSTSGGTWTGGTTVRRGVLAVGTAAVGTGSVNIGASSGNTATLRIGNNTIAFTSSIVADSSSGTNQLELSSTTAGTTVSSSITLDGNLTVAANRSSTISGAITGSGDLIKGQFQGGNSALLTLTGTNTYSGDTVINNGAFTLGEVGSLTFYIGADGVNNQVNGTTNSAVNFIGSFNFNVTSAELVDGNSWTIVNLANTAESYGVGFTVAGFNYDAQENVWTNGGFTFDTTSGLLTYAAIPEPASFAALAGAGLLGLALMRRQRRSV